MKEWIERRKGKAVDQVVLHMIKLVLGLFKGGYLDVHAWKMFKQEYQVS